MAVPVQIHPLVKSSQGPRDAYGRAMNYLRISLTDAATSGVLSMPASESSSHARAPDGCRAHSSRRLFVKLGINKIRSGRRPTVRPHLVDIIVRSAFPPGR